MSTHKHIDKICCMIISLALVLTVIFMNGEKLGIASIVSSAFQYENRIFDTSKVHTIDIVMDDTEKFFEEAEKEEYTMCTAVIDGEKITDIAIRAKGNTSLSQVRNYNNDRYSFKIEFDHYDNSKSYYGLDKLCLNNIIQDNTYMKDYLTYKMMDLQGVCAPLCSYAYITFNGEDHGLYLAVESIEDSFLERNYGATYGDLYKPDSMDMGGGKGNGEKFDMDKFSENNDNSANFSESNENDTTQNANPGETKEANGAMETPSSPSMPGSDMTPPNEFDGFGGTPDMQGGTPPQFDGENMPEDKRGDFGERPDMPNGQAPSDFSGENANDPAQEGHLSSDADENPTQNRPDAIKGQGNVFGSNSVALVYTDDDLESYSDIFENAKTDATTADKTRLISSLKQLNENENIDSVVDTDSVINYFAVHNFVLNFDSYTGSMLHNYYLYEEDGIMSMIPWDYNLAFGGFQSASSAEKLVNYPIDSPVSGGDIESRPMLSWIFKNEEYTEKYHEALDKLITEFFESGEFEKLIDETVDLISPYVEKDPTKFCTFDEFTKGAQTLKDFCILRSESIRKQLSGELGSTDESQKTNSENSVKADDINISDMGSMNNNAARHG